MFFPIQHHLDLERRASGAVSSGRVFSRLKPVRDRRSETPPCASTGLPRLLLALFLVTNAGRAGPVGLSPQVITLPASASAPLFVDGAGTGRCDLHVIDQAEKTLWLYHQGPDGFASLPDQVIPLPPQTAWVALGDVDPHPGLELLMATATGLVYSRQNAGRFETERRPLITSRQVFTNGGQPLLISLGTNQDGTILIPVVTADQAVVYQRNSAYEWNPGPPITLVNNPGTWSVDENLWRNPWVLGSNPAHSLRVRQSSRTKPEPSASQKLENEGIRKIMDDMEKTPAAGPPHADRVDVAGDGREDLVLWQISGKLDFKTDIYIFRRGADQLLPGQPTQVLHEHGWPVPCGPRYDWSPVQDLKGDGTNELVLLEFKTAVFSASGLVQTILSHGTDWALTIRTFQNGAFSHSPVASVPVTLTMPAEVLACWPILIHGDFNGDGRPDLLVRRTDTQWNIFFSTTDGRWFAPQPAMTFDAPANGYMEIQDLDGDGLADIIWHEPYRHTLSIFMSPPGPAKGKKP